MAPALIALVAAFFLLHYLFASLTAHTTALLPTMLVVAAAIPGMNVLAAGAGAEHDDRHHGHHHAVRHRAGADLRRQRLSAGEGLLAAGHDLRR